MSETPPRPSPARVAAASAARPLAPSGAPALLAAAELQVSYPGRGVVLSHVSLAITSGRRVVLVGANGSGKTTLLRTLSGALRPDAGRITVHGKVLRHSRTALNEHRRGVQLVLQDPDDQLFSADVYQDVAFGPTNLGLPPGEVRDRVDEALHMLDIADLAHRPVHHLSFGQRKRVALAGAVAMRPALLLLDEPTAGLDPHGVASLLAGLDRLEVAGTTVALSTHNVDLAWSWADEVAIVAAGTVRQLDVAAALADEQHAAAAGLVRPWQVRLLDDVGVPWHAASRPRSIEDVAGAIRSGYRPPHA